MRILVAALFISSIAFPVFAQSALAYVAPVKDREKIVRQIVAARRACAGKGEKEFEACMKENLKLPYPTRSLSSGDIYCEELRMVVITPPSDTIAPAPGISRTAQSAPVVMGSGFEQCVVIWPTER